MISIKNKYLNEDNIRNIHKIDYQFYAVYVLMLTKKSNMRSKHGCVIIDNRGKIISISM